MAKRSKPITAPLEDLTNDVQAIRHMMEFEALYLLPAFTFAKCGTTFYLLQPFPEKIAPGHDYAKLQRMFSVLCMAGELIPVTRKQVPFPDYDRHLDILVHGTFLVFRSDWKKSHQRLFTRTTLQKVIGAHN